MLKIDPSQLRWLKVRMVLCGALLFAGLLGIIRRAYELQVRERGKFRAMAEEQYLKEIDLPPRRGQVLDRTGARLALTVDVDSIYANPRMIGDDAPEVAARLAPLLGGARNDLERRLSSDRYFAWVARRVSSDTARAVQRLGLDGIFLTREPKRSYPAGDLAGPVLGFADADARGIEGVELSLDRLLRGERVAAAGVRDALGRELLPAGLPDLVASGGADVALTLDRFIEFTAERALAAAIAKHHARAGSVTVLDPRTGEILALASFPTYDPNDPQTGARHGARDRPVTDAYEPGSTLKTFTIAAALEAGVVRPTDEWDCLMGKMQVGGFTIHDTHPHGILTTTEILAKSSNIGAAKIAHKLGRERLDRFLRELGFARPTGVELPGEGAGRLKPAPRWGDTDLATIAFGQAMTATPLQLLTALAAIADGGVAHPPRLVTRVVNGKGQLVASLRPESRRVMSPRTAHTMTEMLKLVTEKGGTAEGIGIPGYKIAGKTGTAQKVDPATRRYSTEKWVSSFMGFVPADEPRLAMLVVIDEPQGSHYGSVVAAPVFRDIAAEALKYLSVPPRPEAMVAAREAAHPPGRAAAHAAPSSEVAAAGPPTGHEPGADEADPDEGGSDEVRVTVPDFTGMSMAEAIGAARRAGLELDLRGSGQAVGQEPGPGPAPRGALCRVEFRPPG